MKITVTVDAPDASAAADALRTIGDDLIAGVASGGIRRGDERSCMMRGATYDFRVDRTPK